MAISNPFSRTSEGERRNITAYRWLTLVAFLLQTITAIYYTGSSPIHGHYHTTPFTINAVFLDIYWIVLWISQVVYIWHLFRSDATAADSAAAVGSHFILFNVLHFVWIMLWVNGQAIVSELVLVVQFLQLTAVYYRYSTAPKLIHLPVSVLPLTWSFFMLYWNGAVAVHCHGLVCRILANVAIWGIVAYAGFFLLRFKDYYVGFATAFLAAGLGVGQFFSKVIALQWPFAFAIMAVVFLASLGTAVPGIFGADSGNEATGRRGERAPLLHETA
jgi:hypothetical protein